MPSNEKSGNECGNYTEIAVFQRIYRLAPSPTTTKGAQKAGWAQWGWLSLAARR